uniref:hypothetical protein n=1 Tax=Faecalibaculum rodentium TaxID=1702221 RepID=UPI0025A57E81
YQKYTPEKERPSIHGGILRYGGSKVHENICTNRPVPNGTLGGVRGSDDTYSIEPAVTGDSFAFCESI